MGWETLCNRKKCCEQTTKVQCRSEREEGGGDLGVGKKRETDIRGIRAVW